MDIVLAHSNFKPHEICSINYCRLYLQAITISDITTASGTQLRLGILAGVLLINSNTTQLKEFCQQCPDATSWRIWRKASKLFSTKHGKLHQPLTEWLHHPSSLRQQWPSYFNPAPRQGIWMSILGNVSQSPTHLLQNRLDRQYQTAAIH